MKLFKVTLILVLIISTSTQCQEKKGTISLNYKAQTRGFQLEIQLQNKVLEIVKNNQTKEANLSNEQFLELNNLLSNINFEAISSSLLIDDVAVDRVVPGTFELIFNQKKYYFEFDHNKPPKDIQLLLDKLQNYIS